MKIGRYTVDHRPSREGGQAFVYFTVDPDTGDGVAVKVARRSNWSQRRMRQEIKAQKRLDHPNILKILDHGDDYRWYATARADSSLDESGPFARERWTYLRVGLMAVASAVAHAHSAGFIRRDLSPGNVLVFRGGWAVSDWGFVYVPPTDGARVTQPLEHFGTPDFAAPEVLSDPMDVDSAADVYSLGRLAAWGTGLRRHETRSDDDSVAGWWRLLINNTTGYDPRSRWTIQDVETHLRGRPSAVSIPLVVTQGRNESTARGDGEPEGVALLADYRRAVDRCPHCLSQLGRDAAERCLGCHAVVPY
jgi:serine/threonine protein kinase